jgi:hypothetical protein
MSVLALIIALAALAVALLALARTGGLAELRHQAEDFGPQTERIRDRTANALDWVAGRLRGRGTAEPEPPGQPERRPEPPDPEGPRDPV